MSSTISTQYEKQEHRPNDKQVGKPLFRRAGLAVALIAAPLILFMAVLIAVQSQAAASSHREAPLISKDAFADNTDTYVFISPENQDNVVLVGSWIPFEGPEGGPNYFEWDENVHYSLFVDNNGDAQADITYTLSSRVEVGNPLTFLYNTGPIDALTSANWNRKQFITVTETTANGTTVLVGNKPTAPVNIGEKSTPNYASLFAEAIYDGADGVPGGIKVFAGQTDDPFWVDLQVFDLLTLRGQNPPIGYENYNVPVDSVSAFNVHSLVIEVPIDRLTANNDPVLGIWAAAARKSSRVLNGLGGVISGDGLETQSGNYVQVSRLGMPLVNEVVIPLALKDAFNTLRPAQDLTIYTDPTFGPVLQTSVEDPEIGRLLCGLYGVPLPADSDNDCSTEVTVGTPRSGRGDIFDIFLTGMVLANPFQIETAGGPTTLPAGFNVNRPANPNAQPAEMIRINTAIKGDTCSPVPSRLGVLGGDACGFPNGRRLTDDGVEIELLAVAGAAYPVLDGRDTDFSFNPALIDLLSDNVDRNDVPYYMNGTREQAPQTFPYLAMPQAGQSHWHTNPYFNVLVPWVQN
ncbi:MAG TPA: DUF4331 domain-containing protein, partial [Caldilineaceae bacterium]|nr:DUF4331 domain-containing protein [Caldilineaceae bacterium]